MSVVLQSITLGDPLPESVLRGALREAWFASWSEQVGEHRSHWTIGLTDDGNASAISLFSEGAWDELLPDYEVIVRTLTDRHGPPTSAPADEDEQRHVDLEPTGMPDDRWWHLRSRRWDGSVRAIVSLYKVWPGRIQLKLSVEPGFVGH